MKPTIHVHTFCYNEEDILPFFLRHYEQFADSIFVYDNGSKDNSLHILRAHPKVEIFKRFTRGKIDNVRLTKDKNNLWKRSRGQADFVIVCDIDEFLVHKNMVSFLERMKEQEATLARPAGYQMVAEEFPRSSKQIYDEIKTGRRESIFDKTVLFDPNRVSEINYSLGSHTCTPTGEINHFEDNDLKLLHYSFLGLSHVQERFKRNRKRLSLRNRIKPWSTHYKWDEHELEAYFCQLKSDAIEVDL